MNGEDLLARTTKALRDITAPACEVEAGGVGATTLARVERSLREGRPRSLSRVRWVAFPIAASFVIFAAWASASGSLAHWIAARSHGDVERPAVVPPTVTAPATAASVTQDPPPVASAPPPEPSAAPPPKRTAPAPSVDVDALYRNAHDAHFVRRDPAAALVAWNRYLAAAGPSGRFALEARYNRALTLVRLGRRAEAAAALKPFTDGDYGGYRREEATELLRTLE